MGTIAGTEGTLYRMRWPTGERATRAVSLAIAAFVAASAFAAPEKAAPQSTNLGATLQTPDGQTRAEIRFASIGAGRTRVTFTSYGGDDLLVGPEWHGIRIDAKKDCDADGDAPYNSQHAEIAPGVLPRIRLDSRGAGSYAIVASGISLSGTASILGHVVVVYHGSVEDLCGTVERS